MKKNVLFLVCNVMTILLTSAQSVPADQFSCNVARDWFSLENSMIKNGTGFTPPVASRALGYTGLTLYEAVVGGIPDYGSLQNKLPGSPVITQPQQGIIYHWPTVANNALAFIIDSLFENSSLSQKYTIQLTRQTWNNLYQSQISAQVFNDSKALGEQIAADIFNYSRTDGGHEGYLSNTDAYYHPPVGPSQWVPTPPSFASALQPHWGSLRCFVAENALSPCIPVNPPTFSADTSSSFYAYAYQVYNTKNHLSAGQTNIAKYWADGSGTVTPPGHSISILSQILLRENSNLAFATLAFAKLSMSQTDAFIACWKTKYTYNLLRPITYIRTYIDSTWNSLITTPPFPEYTSGHSTQSGAMSTIMSNLFGTTYAFTDSTNGGSYGGPRTYSSFDEAAYETATSRLYAGIHYEFSNVLAITLGKQIGENILALFESVHNASSIKTQNQISFSLYPNPTSDYMLINSERKLKQMELFDMQGKLVMINLNPYVLDLSQLAKGMYITKVYDSNDQVISEKLITKL